MCNRYRHALGWTDYAEDFSELKIPLVFDPSRIPNLEPRLDVRPTNMAPVFRPVDADDLSRGVAFAELRWGLVPWWRRGALKDFRFLGTNARAEAVSTTRTYKDAFARRRCLVPADGFYEWTGPKGDKTKWLFTRADGDWFCFPGLWERWESPDGPLESFTLMTTAPGPDAAPYHDRQPVILPREHWATWLDLAADVVPLLVHGPAGELRVEPAPPETRERAGA